MAYSRALKRKTKRTLRLETLADAEKVLTANDRVEKAVKAGVDRGIAKFKEKIHQEVVADVAANTMLVHLWVMYDKYGFKMQRLTKYLNNILDMWDTLSSADRFKLTTRDLNQALINELGFDTCKKIIEYDVQEEEAQQQRDKLYGAYVKLINEKLDIKEAADMARKGKKIAREVWEINGNTPFYIFQKGNDFLTDEKEKYYFSADDLAAEDWKVIQK